MFYKNISIVRLHHAEYFNTNQNLSKPNGFWKISKKDDVSPLLPLLVMTAVFVNGSKSLHNTIINIKVWSQIVASYDAIMF